MKRRRSRIPYFSYAMVILGGLVMVVPFADLVMTAFKSKGEFGQVPYQFLPDTATLDNFLQAITELELGRLFRTSAIATLAVTLSVLITSAMAGYALGKLRFRGRDAIFRFVLATMMLPHFLLLIPHFLILVHWPLAGGNDILGRGGDGGLAVNILALIVPFLANGFGIFLMRQFMTGIPMEMLEAARIDGANEWQLFARVVLPQVKPVAITLALITFVNQWNEFIWASLVASMNPDVMSLPVGIQKLQGFLDPDQTVPIVMAGIVISSIPVLILFLIFQKHYVRGVMMSGLK